MLHLIGVVAVKGVGDGAVARQMLKGQRANELRGVLRHDDMYVAVLLDQGGGQGRGLIAGDAARDAQQHGFSFQHGNSSILPGRAILPG